MASVPAQVVAASSAGSTTSEASTVEAQEPGLTSPHRDSHPLISPVGAYLPRGLHRLGDYPYRLVAVSEDKLQAHGPRH